MSKMFAFPEKLFCGICFYEKSFVIVKDTPNLAYLFLKKHRMIDLHIVQTGRS